MRKIFSDSDLQSTFMERGFVQVPMLGPSEINAILAKLPELKPADDFAPSARNEFEQTYHCSFLDKSIAYKRRTFELISEVFGTYVDRYLSGYRILSCNFYVKPPGTGTFVIHQNWPTIPNINDTTVTIWCPLSDVVASNGALQFVPGSHKILPHVEGPISPAYFDHFRQTLIDKYLKPNPMVAGEALIFDDGLIHWSANNDSQLPRVAIQIACVPVDTSPVFFFFDPHHPERFELVQAGPEFYLSSDIMDLTQRQPGWKSVGFVENQNRFIDEGEFITLLANGPKLRERIYATEENPLKPIPTGSAAVVSTPEGAVRSSEVAGHAVASARVDPLAPQQQTLPGAGGFWSGLLSSVPRFFSSLSR